MKKQVFGLLVALAFVSFLPHAARSDTKSGAVRLQEATFEDADKKGVKISLGNQVKADCTYYITDFNGKKVISVQATVKNTSKKTLYYGYYVAFFDNHNNLIATSGFSGDLAKLEPGKDITIGNVIELPMDQIKRITAYKVTLLEDEKEFGR